MGSFYLTLPSNVRYHGNTCASFRCPLPQTINLEGEWECGLTSIHYPSRDFGTELWVKYITAEEINQYYMPDSVEYRGMTEFINSFYIHCLRPLAPKHRDDLGIGILRAALSKEYNKIFIVSDEKTIISKIIFSPQLSAILGVKQEYVIPDMEEQIKIIGSEDRLNIFRSGSGLMYVYCDTIQNQFVGDVLAPLLRIVPMSEEKTHDYTNIHYVPVLPKSIKSILINIRTGTGLLFPFVTGNTVVKLHLRKKS